MKYISIDELNNFSFHDATIQKIDLYNGKMKWLVSAVNATIENSQNNFEKDMCIEEAEITFENVNIEKIVFGAYKVYDTNENLIESVDEKVVHADEYDDILRKTVDVYCYILSMEELSRIKDEKYCACFNIDGGAGNYFLTLSFEKFIVQWNEYSGFSWYEDEKWKKREFKGQPSMADSE